LARAAYGGPRFKKKKKKLRHVGIDDAGLALRHDVEEAWARGEYCAVIAADVKQFFPLLDHTRLIHLLGLYGYPPQVTSWVSAFLKGRTYAFRIGGIITQRRPFHGLGVPQGLPLSPVLAATYIAAATDIEGCQVYVDDAAVKGYATTALAAATQARDRVETLVSQLYQETGH
jgi:hypothetical protein